MTAIDVKDATALKTVLTDAGGALVVVHFWADWAPQCQQMDAVMAELHKAYPTIKLARVEAEALADVSEEYEIMAVPTMLLFKLSKVVDRVNGANAPELSAKVQKHQAVVAQVPKLAEVAVEDPKLSLNDKLHKLINAAPMMLFMKGTADEPQCGFSRTMVELLRSVDAEFSTFNILADDEVRQGLKTYSNWQTYPQLYINGELIGGLDVVKELQAEGELAGMLPCAKSEDELHARLAALIRRAPVMLFMKGTPDEPRCGFSRTMVGILRDEGIEFGHYDILGDNEVRQGLKTYSNWPTYPQLYVNGELIGGLDIVKELKEAGELQETLTQPATN